jgi:hypothetical protein
MEINAAGILREAESTLRERASQRDCEITGERSMASTVATFNALTGFNLSEENGWEFMCILKMVRGRQGKARQDDYVDLSSYGALLGECRIESEKYTQGIKA